MTQIGYNQSSANNLCSVPVTRIKIPLISAATLLLITLALIPRTYMGMDEAIHKTMDAGHFAAFGLFALLLQHLLSHHGEKRAAVISLAISTLLIVGIELIQPYVGRTAALSDVANGLFGVAAFLMGRHIWLTASKNYIKHLYAFVTATLFIVIAKPAITEWHIAWWRMHHFPVLGEFEDAIEHEVWRAQGTENGLKTQVSLSPEYVRYGKTALKIEAVTGDFSGVNYRAGGKDWSSYSSLNIALYNPDEPFSLFSRIDDDTPTPTYQQRFNSTFKLTNGWNLINIPLTKIANAPKKGTMNMQAIHKVVLFTHPKDSNRIFYLDRVWLE
ncbi:VanZ family protein [Pseudomonadota bacterium]